MQRLTKGVSMQESEPHLALVHNDEIKTVKYAQEIQLIRETALLHDDVIEALRGVIQPDTHFAIHPMVVTETVWRVVCKN